MDENEFGRILSSNIHNAPCTVNDHKSYRIVGEATNPGESQCNSNNRCIGITKIEKKWILMPTVVSVNFSCKAVLATVVSVIAIRHTSHPSVVLKTMMNVSRDRDLAVDMSRGIGFVGTDMICSGSHGNVGTSNLEKIDLVCVCCVLNMQKYAQSMGCANRYQMASSKRRNLTTVEVFQKHYGDNQVPNVNEV